MTSHRAAARVLAVEAAIVALAAAALVRWFTGAPALLPSWLLPLAGLLALFLRRALLSSAGSDHPGVVDAAGPAGWRRRVRPETALCVLLALAYRAPALASPQGLVNRDGAYPAYVAMHLLDGIRPAPVFTEGANYQGTLKGHLAALGALLTGSRDFAALLVAVSLALWLVFLVATMALARRCGGPPAALFAGLWLALGPRFATILTLNCVGQYVDVLALGGVALALLARLLDEDRSGFAARGAYFGIGVLLGAAFWQQPVALGYVAAVVAALALRGRSWRDPWVLVGALGFLVGVLPVLLWNFQNGWGSGDIMGRDPSELRAQVEALPRSVRRTVTVAFPILVGLSPGHPWGESALVRAAAQGLLPMALAVYVALTFRRAWTGVRSGAGAAVLLPPLLTFASLGLFWAIASGSIHMRPRYLLPVVAAGAVHIGVALAALAAWRGAAGRLAAGMCVVALVASNARVTVPRLLASDDVARPYLAIVASLDEKRIRTGYADFTVAAPVTMFTAENITLSPELGPTPVYVSDVQAQRVAREGPDAFVLRPGEDPASLAAALDALGVGYRLDREPVAVFWGLSRRVALREVLDAWTPGDASSGEAD